jgi:hypothetical protein
VNRPAGSTPGDRPEDLGTEAVDETDETDETDDAQRPRAEPPPSRLPEGYEPL